MTRMNVINDDDDQDNETELLMAHERNLCRNIGQMKWAQATSRMQSPIRRTARAIHQYRTTRTLQLVINSIDLNRE